MSKVPSIGEMRQVFSIELFDKNSDLTGGQEETPAPFYTTRGKLKIKRSYSKFETGYDGNVKEYDLWVPWRHELEANISKDSRVIFENRSMRVETFDMVNDERKIFHMELTDLR
jgi:hypothetical protein